MESEEKESSIKAVRDFVNEFEKEFTRESM